MEAKDTSHDMAEIVVSHASSGSLADPLGEVERLGDAQDEHEASVQQEAQHQSAPAAEETTERITALEAQLAEAAALYRELAFSSESRGAGRACRRRDATGGRRLIGSSEGDGGPSAPAPRCPSSSRTRAGTCRITSARMLSAHGIIREAEKLVQAGHVRCLPEPNIYGGLSIRFLSNNGQLIESLRPEEMLVIRHVIAQFGKMSITQIVNASKKTESFKNARQYEELRLPQSKKVEGTTEEDVAAFRRSLEEHRTISLEELKKELFSAAS